MAESSTSPLSVTTPVASRSMPDFISEGVGVVVRVRPLSTKERADPSVHNCIHALPDIVVIDANARKQTASVNGRVVTSTGNSSPSGSTGGRTPPTQPMFKLTRPYQFSVDRVFHTHASQIEVYEESCKRIVEGVFHGINGSILAYGATGSGKTHTMFGSTMSAAGIVYQAMQDIFAEKERLEEEEGKRVRIKCSFLEVYNEEVFDLLVKTDGGSSAVCPSASGTRQNKRVPLQVREAGLSDGDSSGNNGSGGLHIPGLIHIFPETLEDFTRGIEHGHAKRFVAATGANAQSSRSHAIITVEVEVRDDPVLTPDGTTAVVDFVSPSPRESRDEGNMSDDQNFLSSTSPIEADAATKPGRENGNKCTKHKKDPTPTVTIASIQFGDLAGSERAASTSNTGLRLREGGNINRSLLALGAVVQSLAQQKAKKRQAGGKGDSKMFIPYRGSKLTRLLRDSIGGNCRTMMLFCISPSTKQIEETVNTMRFAMNAREIQVMAYRNEFAVNSSQLAKTQETVIEELRAELARTRAALAHFTGEELTANEVKEVASSGAFTEAGRHESPSAFDRRMSSTSIGSPTVANANTNHNGGGDDSAPHFGSAAAAVASAAPPRSGTPSAIPPRATMTPSTSPGGGCPLRRTLSPLSGSAVEVSASNSMPRHSLSSRTARPSVFAEHTRVFSDLEAKLKDFSAQKESLYHEVRDAEERERDGEAQLRDLQWRLATFLVSDAYGSRARGETDLSSVTSTVGVAGLRKTIASMEEAQVLRASQLTDLTSRLEEADRQFAATRKALLRERQGTSLELLLDNARLRQGCTEAECLAAHYHQECRSLLNGEAEYAEALSKCIGALQRVRPILLQLHHRRHSSVDSSSAAAALETVDVALLFALLPTSSTAQRMQTFEAALRATTVAQAPHSPDQEKPEPENQTSLSPAFVHPPLAPSPTNRSNSDSGSLSPTRNGRSVSTPQSKQLAEQFRDLVAKAESMHLTGGGDGGPHAESGEGNGSGSSSGAMAVRTRHGHDSFAHNQARAFGRTVSLTGLTAAACSAATTTATASAEAAETKGRKKKKTVGFTTGALRGEGGTGKGPSPAAGEATKSLAPSPRGAGPLPFQRSLSAPLPFSHSASAGLAAGNGGGGTLQRTPGKKSKHRPQKPVTVITRTIGGPNNSPSRAMPASNLITPQTTPSKNNKSFRTYPSYRLSPKAMWSVAGTNDKNKNTHPIKHSKSNSTAACARSNTVRTFCSPSKQRSGRGSGESPSSSQQQHRLWNDTAASPDKTAPRISAEDTPYSSGSGSTPSTGHRQKEGAPLNTLEKRTGITDAEGSRNNAVAATPSQRGNDRRRHVIGEQVKRRVLRKSTRSKTSTAAATTSSACPSASRDVELQNNNNPIMSAFTTFSPALSSYSNSDDDVDGAGSPHALCERENGSVSYARCGSAKGQKQNTAINSRAPSTDSTHDPSQEGKTRLTVARLLERSATVPIVPYYNIRSPIYSEDGGADLNKENQQRVSVHLQPRNSLPDDLTVSRSTLFSDSPVNNRDVSTAGKLHQEVSA